VTRGRYGDLPNRGRSAITHRKICTRISGGSRFAGVAAFLSENRVFLQALNTSIIASGYEAGTLAPGGRGQVAIRSPFRFDNEYTRKHRADGGSFLRFSAVTHREVPK
jgi:hypothetical protein